MNNDLISRSALLEKAIEEKRFVFRVEDLLREEVIFQTVYKDLASFILSAPAVDAGPKWISVEDRLPEESGEYLVVTRGGVCMTMAYSAVHRVFNAFDWGEANAPINCDYWMPLPEMPKEV